MVKYEEFEKWLRKIPKTKTLYTKIGARYNIRLDDENVIFKINSSGKERIMALWSTKAIFERYKKDKRKKILVKDYNSKESGESYTMSASYILPLLADFFKNNN